MTRNDAPDRYAVSGTPVDAVLMGLFKLCPRRPDLIVSGINHGLNVGTDVFYSGTLAAALEGAIQEIPAMAVCDAVTRLLPGVLLKEDAAAQESFSEDRLDFPQYTRPRVWRRKKVPEVLLGGDHAKIARWRSEAALRATRRKRPDLLKK